MILLRNVEKAWYRRWKSIVLLKEFNDSWKSRFSWNICAFLYFPVLGDPPVMIWTTVSMFSLVFQDRVKHEKHLKTRIRGPPCEKPCIYLSKTSIPEDRPWVQRGQLRHIDGRGSQKHVLTSQHKSHQLEDGGRTAVQCGSPPLPLKLPLSPRDRCRVETSSTAWQRFPSPALDGNGKRACVDARSSYVYTSIWMCMWISPLSYYFGTFFK